MSSELQMIARRVEATLADFSRAEEIRRAVDGLGDAEEGAGQLLPYTSEAIIHLERLLEADPGDARLLHHLAIARHARAWDWELAADPRAAAEWERALSLWRRLQTDTHFWEGLSRRLRKLNGGSDDSDWLERVRGSLLEQLIRIHVDFVCHWTNEGRNDLALSHVRIIRKAQIPPAARSRMIGLVFEFMTGGVAEARERRDYAGALSALDAFRTLFPDHSPALRQSLEICADWVDSLAQATEWQTIEALAHRSRPVQEEAAKIPPATADPLLRPAMMELATLIALNARKRGESFFESDGVRGDEESAMRSAIAAFQLGHDYAAGLVHESPAESYLRRWFHQCCVGWAVALRTLSIKANNVEGDARKALALLRPAFALLEDAQKADYDERLETTTIPKFEADLAVLMDE